MANLGNPKNTIAVLQKYGFNFQKKYGQNFLIDSNILDKIIRAADVNEEDCVLEIGGNRHNDTSICARMHARLSRWK